MSQAEVDIDASSSDWTGVVDLASVSPFHPSPGQGADHYADDLDRLAASLDHLKLCCSEPHMAGAPDHIAIEPMGEHNQVLGNVVHPSVLP
jgi:hypothetical protein